MGLTGRARLVALDIVALNEQTVDRYDFTGLENGDITDEYVL